MHDLRLPVLDINGARRLGYCKLQFFLDIAAEQSAGNEPTIGIFRTSGKSNIRILLHPSSQMRSVVGVNGKVTGRAIHQLDRLGRTIGLPATERCSRLGNNDA
ncbi:hypothetical protein D3C87_1777980 [compost metagenome]